MLEASLPEKLEFVRSNHLFGYPAYDHILRDLQDLVAFPRSLKPECRAVIADSDNGKTTLTRQFIANNPIVLDEAGYPITKVLWVETPASADERRLYSAILSALNVTHRPDAPQHGWKRLRMKNWPCSALLYWSSMSCTPCSTAPRVSKSSSWPRSRGSLTCVS